MDINLELYKVFYYVATTLSFSEASRQLFISQSAVSQSIKTLEKKLGHTLFIRSTKRVQLTPEGETLLRHVEPAINLIARGEAQIMEREAWRRPAPHRRERHNLPLFPCSVPEPFPPLLSECPHQGDKPDFDPVCRSAGIRPGGFHRDQLSKLASFQPSSHDSDSFVPRYLHRERRILPGTGKQAGSLKRAAAVPDSDARPQEYDE